MDKEFKTYNEQIELLKNKRLNIGDERQAIEILKNISYFALINGYKRPFKGDNGNYRSDACFDDIVKLYDFDEKLRFFLLRQLLAVETRIKSSISYNFTQNYKVPNAYFDVNNFDYHGKNITDINKLVSILQGIHSDTSHPYIDHYQKKHNGNIPLWVIINAMTFGQVSKMYSLLKAREQQCICGDFGIASQREMRSALDILTLFRNVCAHNERLYDFKTQRQIVKRYIEPLAQCDPDPDYNNMGKKLFGALAFCSFIAPDRNILNDFKQLVNSSDIMKNQRLRDRLIAKMGIPVNWLTDIRN